MTDSPFIYSDIISLGNGLGIEIVQNNADDFCNGQCCYLTLTSITACGVPAQKTCSLLPKTERTSRKSLSSVQVLLWALESIENSEALPPGISPGSLLPF